MGNSCVTGSSQNQKPKETGARIVPQSPAVQTTFKWKIDGFSSLLDMDKGWTWSSFFEIMGLDWFIGVNPRDQKSGDEKDYVHFRLVLSQKSVRPNTVVEASFKLVIYDQKYRKHRENEEMLCVHKIDDTFKNDRKVYTWDIEDFFLLKSPDYSPEFELCGHKWSIGIFPAGDKNKEHLFLFLKMNSLDTLHENSATLVEFSISIKDQATSKRWKLSGRCPFSKKVDSWGFYKFMSLEDFKNSSKGYLVKTKCCIEAEVTIIGSSKIV